MFEITRVDCIFYQQDVKITNPSSFGSVSETATTETLAYTLMFASAVPHTCTIDTYSPTRPEGNPFLIKATPTSGKLESLSRT